MRMVLFITANLLAFTCAMSLWQFNFPPRLFIFDILSVLFIIMFLLYYFTEQKKFFLTKELKYFILFQWLYLLLVIISGLKIIFFSGGQQAFIQYFKGMSLVLVYVIFFTFFILYLSAIKSGSRKKILTFYIAGVTCSCVYGMVQVLIYKKYGVDIDYLWKYVSYNTEYNFDAKVAWAVMGIVRGRGFPGINAQSTYIITVFPLLFLFASHTGRFKNILLVIISVLGLLVTMSRTGLVSFGVAVLALIFLERRRLVGLIKVVFLISGPMGYLVYIWREYIGEILKFRTQIDFSRLELFKGGLSLFYENPLLGVGINNYSIARLSLPSDIYHDMNLHNSWLTILVEIGIFGLLLQLGIFTYMVCVAFRRESMLSRAFICSLAGLSAGAFFNQVFDSFYFSFYVGLVFSSIALRDIPIQQ